VSIKATLWKPDIELLDSETNNVMMAATAFL